MSSLPKGPRGSLLVVVAKETLAGLDAELALSDIFVHQVECICPLDIIPRRYVVLLDVPSNIQTNLVHGGEHGQSKDVPHEVVNRGRLGHPLADDEACFPLDGCPDSGGERLRIRRTYLLATSPIDCLFLNYQMWPMAPTTL